MPDTKLTLDDDLEGLSAEELEELIELDNGDAVLSPDDQNFSINGIDELNGAGDEPPTLDDEPEPDAPPAPVETPPVDEPETPPAPAADVTPEPEPFSEPDVIDYQAKYNETMTRLAEQKLLDDAAASTPAKEPEPVDTRTAYERAMETITLDTEQQARFDELAEFDEDAANDFMERAKEKRIVSALLDKNEKDAADQREAAANAQKSEQQKFTDAINESTNLSTWQKDKDTWDDVQGMHKRLLRDPEYAAASTGDKMKKLEKRFASFSGINSDQKPVEPDTPPVDNPAAQKIIDKVENDSKPPSSLSAVSGGNADAKPGRVKLDNSSDAIDIQKMMDDAAASDDPEAIDKLLSSVDFG